MTTLGVMAAGMAHELNNPLTAIIGIAQLLQSGTLGIEVKQDLEKLVLGPAARITLEIGPFHLFGRVKRGAALLIRSEIVDPDDMGMA